MKDQILTTLPVEIVFFAHSAANCVNFSGYVLRVVHGLDPSLSGNCGRSSNGELKAPSPLAEEWINKGISMAAITRRLSTCS